MSQTIIQFTGNIFTLPVIMINIKNENPETIEQAIKEKIRKMPLFLERAPVVINVSNFSSNFKWTDFFKKLINVGLHIIGAIGCNDSRLEKEITKSGLLLLHEGKKKDNFLNGRTSSFPYLKTKKTKLIRIPVRSGQQIYAENSDLIVTNNVSSGAELIADGNIHIYGTMRGRALAGAKGDKECQIFCTCIFPEIISISGRYWLIDQIPISFLGKSARFFLKNDMLSIHHLS